MLTNEEQKEADRIISYLCSVPLYGNTTTTKKIAKELLLRDFYMANGEIWDLIVEHRGLGVYRLSFKQRYL